MSWQEFSPSGLSQDQLAAIVAPWLIAVESLAVPCPNADSGAAPVGGAVADDGGAGSGGGSSSDTGAGDESAIVGGGDANGAFTDFVLGDEGFEVTREEAAAAAAAATGIVALTTLIVVVAGNAGAAAQSAAAAVGAASSGTRTVTLSGDAAREAMRQGAGGEIELAPEDRSDLHVESGGQVATGDHLGTHGRVTGIGPVVEGDDGSISVSVDVETFTPAPPAPPPPPPTPRPAQPEPSVSPDPAPADPFADAILDELEDAPPVGAPVVAQSDFDQDNRPDITGFDTTGDGQLDTTWTPEQGREELDDSMKEMVRQVAEQQAEADAEPPPAVPAAAPEAAAPEPVVEEPAPAEEAAPSEEAGAEPPPQPPGEMSATELADLLRTDPRAEVLEAEDIDALTRLIEDPDTRQIEIAPPVGKPVIKDVGIGFLKTDINLNGVSNTGSGVSFELTGGIRVPVGVENGRVVLDLPERYAQFTSAADGYLGQINRAFAESGRRIESIRMNDDSFLEIKTESASAARIGDGEWDASRSPTDTPDNAGTRG